MVILMDYWILHLIGCHSPQTVMSPPCRTYHELCIPFVCQCASRNKPLICFKAISAVTSWGQNAHTTPDQWAFSQRSWGGGISCTHHIGPGNVQMLQQSSLSSFIDVCFCLVWHQATHISTTGQQNPHLCINQVASHICLWTTVLKPRDLHHWSLDDWIWLRTRGHAMVATCQLQCSHATM